MIVYEIEPGESLTVRAFASPAPAGARPEPVASGIEDLPSEPPGSLRSRAPPD
jgi:hypothetical protein